MTESKKIFTTPQVRKFARELGANISQIQGSERKGRITQDDVKKFISSKLDETKQKNKLEKDFNHSDFGEIEIKEIPRVKKLLHHFWLIHGKQFPTLHIMMKQM